MEKGAKIISLFLLSLIVIGFIAVSVGVVSAAYSIAEFGGGAYLMNDGETVRFYDDASEAQAEASRLNAQASPGTTPASTSGSGAEENAVFEKANELVARIPLLGILVAKGEISEKSASGEFIKLFFMLLVIILIYSSLNYVNFPEQPGLRWLLAGVTGFLATVLISSNEIIAILESYKALGIAMTLFFPLMILAFFTFVVTTKVSVFGILIQRILWMIYSIYLFFRAAGLLLIRLFGDEILKRGGTMEKIATFLLGKNIQSTEASPIILIVMIIVAIVVFWIFVYKNKALAEWLIKEKREAEGMKYRDTSETAKQTLETDAARGRSS